MLVPLVAALAMMAGSPAAAPMRASELTWQAHFAKHPTDSTVMFTLMSIGGFLAPTSSAHDQLIQGWLAAHPKAVVVKVGDMGSWRNDNPSAHMYYVWLVDGVSNLNLHLIEVGDVAGPTMEVPSNNELLIPATEYAQFIEKALVAHKAAKEKRLGIWANPEDK